MSARNVIIMRLCLLFLAFIGLSTLIAMKIFDVQYSNNERLKTLETHSILPTRITLPHRGDILARDGKKLAFSIPTYKIYLDFQVINQLKLETDTFSYVDDLAKNCAAIIGKKTQAEYKTLFLKGMNTQTKDGKPNQYFPFITTPISYEQRRALQNKCRLMMLPANKSGIMIESAYERVNPYGNMALRTIGKTGAFMSGLDKSYNSTLYGTDGEIAITRNFGWNLPELISPVQDGMSITTTLDVGIQQVATKALTDMVSKQHAAFGCAVVMNVATGEILAISNIEKNSNDTYSEGGTNYATNYRSPPGSTFKLASMIALLEDGSISMTDSVDTGNGSYLFPGTTKIYKDTHANHWLTPKGIMANSSNIGIIKLVSKAFKGRAGDYVDRIYNLQLKYKLGLDVEEISPSFKMHPNEPGAVWYTTDLPSMSIGYVVELSPMQILTLYNAIANNGKMVKPQFVLNIKAGKKVVKSFSTETIKASICSQSTVKKIKEMLEAVVLVGTAKNIRNNNYSIAGKTGTIEINEKNGNTITSEHQASFCGYFPADKPKYSCIVVVNKPQINKYGGTVAAVVFKQISDYIYLKDIDLHENQLDKDSDIVKIPYSKNGRRDETLAALNDLHISSKINQLQGDWISTKHTAKTIEASNINGVKSQVPNVVGMGMKDALYCLEHAGIKVSVTGYGTVAKQSIEAGSNIKSNSRIVLTLQ